MATYTTSISFTTTAKSDEAAQKLADRIGNYVTSEDMAQDYVVVDLELLDDQEDDLLGFDDEDDE